MTLYYPQGLYGPICDIQPTPEVETIVRQVIIQEPKINLTTDGDGSSGGTSGSGGTGGIVDGQTNFVRLIPKICRTVSITNLYGGDFGPICDLGPGGDSKNINPLTICIVDPPVLEPTYNPIGTLPPEFPVFLPEQRCKTRTIDLPTPEGIQTVVYYYQCTPNIGDYSGPDPTEYGIDPTKKKIKYKYSHSMVCGATDYYSSPGIYQNTIPQGIDLINIFAFGAGGGAGGTDAAQGPTGSGNNSGGTGSFMFTTVTLDPSISNTVQIVVGGGGDGGKGWHNRPELTFGGYNRGGKGGHPGPSGVSGAGGGGGGSTDVFLNDRLIMSVSGGGGGGANGCNFFRGSTGLPYANWNNYQYNNDPTTTSSALKVSRFSPLMAVTIHEPTIKHSLWSDWFKEYVVWFDANQTTLAGQQLENRVNLNFDVAGTYTFEFQGDNQLAIYIAPWYDPGEGIYVEDNLYNGSVAGIRDVTANNNVIPVDSDGNLLPPNTLPANISGAQNWTKVGFTTNFTTASPDTATFNVTTPGRYVVRTFLENAFGDYTNADWLRNPGGMAIVIKRPNGSILWTTKSAFGSTGESRTFNDGGGGGGGGGNEGNSGLSSTGMGLTGGSCSDADSTAQGGSAGWSYVIDHPAVDVGFFGQAPAGYISGWNTPTPKDSSVRRSGGGFGGGRPNRMSIIFDGTAYSLYNDNGSFKTVLIPGMGTGVWEDFMDGKTFQYHYFWGVTRDGNPDTTVPTLLDQGANFGSILLGAYQPAFNCNATQRDPLYRARSLELAFQWTPIKVGSNTWNTQVRLVGIPSWGMGTGFAQNDILPGVMPPSRSQGTQPWWDILYPNLSTWLTLEFYDQTTKKVLLATIPGSAFNFSIRIDNALSSNDYRPTNGQHGFGRTQYFSANYEYEEIEV